MNRSVLTYHKSEVSSKEGVVCAHHLAAAEAGADMLSRGGNAVDAAVAAAFAVGVAEPYNSGVGGIAQLLFRDAATGRVTVFDGTSVLPRAIRPDLFPLTNTGTASGMYGWPEVVGDRNNTGWLAPAVPGMPSCLLAAHERFGRLKRRDVIAPSIRLAADGIPVDWDLTLSIVATEDRIARFPSTREIYFRPSGLPLAMNSFSGAADTLRQPHLAVTLDRIAMHGATGLYEGEVARRIADEMARNGGLIDLDDLSSYRVRVFEAGVTIPYRDCEVTVAPETGGGLTVVQTLRLLAGTDLASSGQGSAESLHYVVESLRRSFVDRFRFLGDPSLVDVAYHGLLSPEYARERLSTVDPNRATPTAGPGDPWRYQASALVRDALPPVMKDAEHTTHISVVDRQGNLVALTSTLGDIFGSGVVVPGTGILLNCGTTWFDPRPGTHNSIEPGRRILWAGSPTIVTRRGRPFAAIGAPGGRKIISALTQVLVNLIDYNIGIQDAVSLPRVHCEGPAVYADSRFPEDVLAALREMGHDIVEQTETIATSYFARPNGVVVDLSTGEFRGGVNPFKPYYAVGL